MLEFKYLTVFLLTRILLATGYLPGNGRNDGELRNSNNFLLNKLKRKAKKALSLKFKVNDGK